MSPLLALSDIAHTYPNGLCALDGLTLALAQGSFTALLGPSGCGKTTTLHLAAGLLAPTYGRVVRAPALARPGAVGFVFQEPVLLPWLNVWHNVALPLTLARRPADEVAERVMAMLRLVGLDGLLHLHPDQLSGGMRMRVAVARALVTRPQLVLMDEPFAALDELARFRLDDELLRLWQAQGFTVLFVTHSIYESVYLAQRVLVMTPRPGRIAAEIPIDVPYPRTADFRTSARFAQLCGQVLAALERADATTEAAP